MSWLPPKRWKVTTTLISSFSVLCRLEGLPWDAPTVTVKTYRWRWLADLAAFHTNAAAAFMPPPRMFFICAEVTPL
jgi:hypothetical protein